MPSAGYQSQGGVLNRITRERRFQEDGLKMALQVVYPNEGNLSYNANRLRVGEADEKGADKPWANCSRNGLDRLPIAARGRDGFAHDWDNRPQMFSRGEFRDDPAIFGVDVDLR